MNRYIKIPLIMGTGYALMQILLFWLEGGLTEELFFRAITSFVTFALLGLFLTFIHSQMVKRKAGSHSEDRFGVCQQSNLTLHLPYERAFDLCCESVEILGGKIKIADRSNGRIAATTGCTLKTFGCKVSYEIKPIGNRLTEIHVTSQPKVRTTLVDYGENLENVERVCEFLSERDDRLDLNLMSVKLKNLSEAKLNQEDNIRTAVERTRE
jgi:hypothetical protein